MTKQFRLPSLEAIQLGEDNRPPQRIQVMRVGTFHHAKYGKFEVTKQHLLSLKKNFDAKVRGVDIALDYSHESEKEAAAWFKSVELSDDGTQLWAETDWTPDGAECVLSKKYRYVSADFSFDYQDNETLQKFGPTLLGAGLTNRPVIKGQAPIIELTEGKGDDVTLEQAQAENDQLKKELAELKEKLGKTASADALQAAQVALAEANKKVTEFAEKEAKAEADKKLAEQKATFDLKLSEGKVVEAQRAPFMSGDMTKFMELAMPVKLSGKGTGDDPSGEKSDDPQAKILELAEKAITDKRATSMSEAISIALSENETLAKEYEEATQPQA